VRKVGPEKWMLNYESEPIELLFLPLKEIREKMEFEDVFPEQRIYGLRRGS
jgi:hypothetical protein